MNLRDYRTPILIALLSCAVSLAGFAAGAARTHSTLSWFAPGMFAALLVRFGSARGPAVAVGVAAAGLLYGFAPVVIVAGTLATVSGPWALSRYLESAGFDRRLQRREDVLRFALATLPASFLTATLLTVGLSFAQPEAAPPDATRCLAAWLSTMLGITLLVPTIATASREKLELWRAHDATAALLLLTVIASLTVGTFMPHPMLGALALPCGVIVVVISAMQLGMTYTGLLATLLTVGVAIIVPPGGNELEVATAAVRVWSFGTVLGVLSLTVRALLAEREAADARLRDAELAYRKDLLETARHEQQRLSREMHDALGQELTAISLLAHHLTGSAPAGGTLGEDARAIANAAEQAQASVRLITQGLAQDPGGSEGLRHALQKLVARARQSMGVEVELALDAGVELEPVAAQSLYRIAQEALTNVMRHSGARRIAVHLTRNANEVELSIADDGMGFARPAAESGEGLGLRTMRYRCELAGGELQVVSAPGSGTVVRCRLPLPASARRSLVPTSPLGDDAGMMGNQMRA